MAGCPAARWCSAITLFVSLNLMVAAGPRQHGLKQSPAHAERVVFAVDTSASMQSDEINIKVRQAISAWTKYFSPQSTSVSVTQLKLMEGLTKENVDKNNLKDILPEADFFGGTCLFCGLKEAARVLEDATANDVAVVMMEERAEDAQHDSPHFALELVQPKFRIYTVALTDIAEPELEELATSTNGESDYVKTPTFARLLLSLDMLPVAKKHSIITTVECELDSDNCPVEFELDESVADSHSSLLIFLCPQTTSASFSSVQLEMDMEYSEGEYSEESMEKEFDADSGCWFYKQENPHSGLFSMQVNAVNDSFSVAVVVKNGDYHKLRCGTYKNNGDTFISAVIDPPFKNEERLGITAYIETMEKTLVEVFLTANGDGSYSSCMKPTSRTGRHSVQHSVYCTVARSGVTMLTSQAPSLKIEDWSSTMEYCKEALLEITTENHIPETMPPNQEENPEPKVVEPITTEKASEEQVSEVDKTWEPVGNISSSNDGKSNFTTVHTNGTQTERDGFGFSPGSIQMIFLVVGGIVLAEVVFIFIRCHRKARKNARERNLIPYAANPEIDRKYERVRQADDENYY